MCLLLAEFLRATLQAGVLPTISLGDELALADRFLAIEQVRFGERLRVDRQVDEQALGYRVPPLFLQPLLENAVRHGIANMLDGGVIQVQVSRAGERLVIAIENPCDPEALALTRPGTGLNNVRQRLTAIFGHEANMNARVESGRFRVDLMMPVTFHE
jgi:LytS/YehU family sensor histidine kinase